MSLESLGGTAGERGMGLESTCKAAGAYVCVMLPPHGQSWFWGTAAILGKASSKPPQSLP